MQSMSLGYDINVKTLLNRAMECSVVYLLLFSVKLRLLNVVAAAVSRLRGTG